MNSIKTNKTLILLGSTGKMGQQILNLLQTDAWKNKFTQIVEVNSRTTASDLLELGPNCVVIDFSNPTASLHWSQFWGAQKIPTLICTTGFQKEEFEKLKNNLSNTAWSFIPNTSLGIFAFIRCLVGLVKFFPDLKSIEIHEVHHIHKKDSPSGTALLIQVAIMNAGFKGAIEVKSKREGEVVGIHSVIMQRQFDRFILTHDAQDRQLFAEGSLLLAEKLLLKAARAQPYTFDELLT